MEKNDAGDEKWIENSNGQESERKTILMKFALSFCPQFYFSYCFPGSWVVSHNSKRVKRN